MNGPSDGQARDAHPGPRLSVLITTRDPGRRPYLEEAIRSCASQDLASGRFEIVVASAYPLEASSLPAGPVPLSVVQSAGAFQGGRIADAAKSARGQFLALMDDDDTFDRTRLRRIVEVLEREPGISYYHNECTLVGPDGRPLPPSTFHRSTSRFKGTGYFGVHDEASKGTEAGRWVSAFAFFNPSSIVISRALAEASTALLTDLPTAPDLALFFLALAAPGKLWFDEAILTHYRIHPGNESMLTWPDMSLEFRTSAVKTMRLVRERFGPSLPPRARDVLDSMILSGSFGVAVLSGRHNQGEVGRAMWRLLRASNSTDPLTRFSSLLVALAYLLNPPAAQWWLRKVRMRDLLSGG